MRRGAPDEHIDELDRDAPRGPWLCDQQRDLARRPAAPWRPDLHRGQCHLLQRPCKSRSGHRHLITRDPPRLEQCADGDCGLLRAVAPAEC